MIPRAELRTVAVQARAEILSELQKESLTSFNRFKLQETLKALQEIVAGVIGKYDAIFRTAVESGFAVAANKSAKELVRRSMDVIREVGAREAAKAFAPSIPTSRILSLSEFRHDLARDVGEEMYHAMKTQLQLSVLKNESLGEMSQRLVGVSKTGPRSALQITNSHAVMIADTETHRAEMAGRFHATNQQEKAMSGHFELWRLWRHSSITKESRDGHVLAGRMHPPIRSVGVFMVASHIKGANSTPEALRYPGDARASASATINCHCLTIERLFPRSVTVDSVERAMRAG